MGRMWNTLRLNQVVIKVTTWAFKNSSYFNVEPGGILRKHLGFQNVLISLLRKVAKYA